jgi:hypothetical protein
MTCWRRLRDWNEAGVWQRLHELLLSELRAADLLDFSRAAVDSSHIRAMKGGPATGPSPVDRGETGSKHHLIVEAHGIPLAAITTGGNRNDVTQLIPLIQPSRQSAASAASHCAAPGICTPTAAMTTRSTRTQGPPIPDHPVPRPARHRARLRPGRVPLGRGRSDRAAALVPSPAHPLGDPRRHPPRVRHPRLRRHLLATTAHRTLSRKGG